MTDGDEGEASRRLSAIVFSDIVGYSKMMGEDEKATLKLLQEHNDLLVGIIRRHGGKLLKFIGDAILSSYPSGSDAVHCGVDIQRAVAARNATRPEKERFQLRIGIHIGDVTERDGDIFGDGVNIAARIQPLADPGGVCISQTVYDIVRARSEIRMVSLGARELKNIKQAIHIYKVDVGEGLGAAPSSTARWALLAAGCAAAAAVAAWLALAHRGRQTLVMTAEIPMAPPAPAAPAAPSPAHESEPLVPGTSGSDSPVVRTAAQAAALPREPMARGQRKGRAEAPPDSPSVQAAWRLYVERQPDRALVEVKKELAAQPNSARGRQIHGLILDYQREYLDAAAEYAAASPAFGDADEAVYCRLLRYIDLKRAGRDADQDLAQYLTAARRGWPLPIAQFYAGSLSEAKLTELAGKIQSEPRKRALAYYLGMHYLLQAESARSGDARAPDLLSQSKESLSQAAVAGSGSVEGQRAVFELARMKARGD